jgi:hypothetical protein
MFNAGLSLEECFRFFAILHQCSGRRSLYDDVVTLMWEESFEHIRYFLVEDLCATLLPSFAASGDDPDDDDQKQSDGPAVRLSRTKAPPSNSQLALRTIQQLSKTRLQLTHEETQKLDQLLLEEEQELMHRFLELMTLIIKNHRESQELEQLIRVLQQLQPIIVAAGAIEDMLLCFRYIGHLAEALSHRRTPMAIGWSQALQRVLPEAYRPYGDCSKHSKQSPKKSMCKPSWPSTSSLFILQHRISCFLRSNKSILSKEINCGVASWPTNTSNIPENSCRVSFHHKTKWSLVPALY